MLINLKETAKNTFRYLTFAILLSLVYDLFWFALNLGSAVAPDVGGSKNLKSFSWFMSFIGFFIRLIMFTVYWKDSVDFEVIMLDKKENVRRQPPNQRTIVV